MVNEGRSRPTTLLTIEIGAFLSGEGQQKTIIGNDKHRKQVMLNSRVISFSHKSINIQ